MKEKLVIDINFDKNLNNEEKDSIVQDVERGIDKQGYVINNNYWLTGNEELVEQEDLSFMISGLKDYNDYLKKQGSYEELVVSNQKLIDKYDC